MSDENKLVLPISVVIPTSFEESWLGRLLESLREQVAIPLEIIVADAFSTDKTREIAASYGVIVVDGGSCPEGRNRGASIAKGEYLLFIDADSYLPTRTTLLEAYIKFLKSGADIASAIYKSDRKFGVKFDHFMPNVIYSGINAFKKIQAVVKKIGFEWGIFVLVKKSVYKHVGGFNEEYKVGEDSKFFQDVLTLGYRYILLDVPVVTSGRRYSQPKTVANIALAMLVGGAAAILGANALSSIRKKNWDRYGELGGKQYKKSEREDGKR
jgi:glycosyltransferase involved in cell wall biosynthesis